MNAAQWKMVEELRVENKQLRVELAAALRDRDTWCTAALKEAKEVEKFERILNVAKIVEPVNC
jgi:flagellar biosynthesis regulator FlaF